jgi:hypothetical protein
MCDNHIPDQNDYSYEMGGYMRDARFSYLLRSSSNYSHDGELPGAVTAIVVIATP